MSANTQNPPQMLGMLKDDLPRPHGSRLGIAIIVAGLLVLLIWAAFSKIDQVTRASARVIAAERTQVIQASRCWCRHQTACERRGCGQDRSIIGHA